MTEQRTVKKRFTSQQVAAAAEWFATQCPKTGPMAGYDIRGMAETVSWAADEIERLEREVRDARDYPAVCGCEYSDDGGLEAMCVMHWRHAYIAIAAGRHPPAIDGIRPTAETAEPPYAATIREMITMVWADPEPDCTVESLLAWLRAQLQPFTADEPPVCPECGEPRTPARCDCINRAAEKSAEPAEPTAKELDDWTGPVPSEKS